MTVEDDQVSNGVMTRSASKRKQSIDSYANRRMTRSACKQQKQQEGEEKPKLPPHKKKKRRKMKMKVVEEDARTKWIRKLRQLTPEERQTYQKRLKESEGFDVGKYPPEAVFSNHIREVSLDTNTERREYSTEAAKMAIKEYNRKKHAKFQFVKLVRVGTQLCTGFMYYITFEAKEDGMAPSPPRNFQALVQHFLGTHIKFCREEKKPQLTEELFTCGPDTQVFFPWARLFFRAHDAEAWHAQGKSVILVRTETSPEDVGGMHAAAGILTARGGMTSHAAVGARGWGKCCIAGCAGFLVNESDKVVLVGDRVIREGVRISLNGSTGEVILGKHPLSSPALSGDLETFMSLAISYITPSHGRDFVVVGCFRCKSWTIVDGPYVVSSMNSWPIVDGKLHWFAYKKNSGYTKNGEVLYEVFLWKDHNWHISAFSPTNNTHRRILVVENLSNVIVHEESLVTPIDHHLEVVLSRSAIGSV